MGASVIEATKPDHEAACEEIFGPTLTILRVDTLDQALAILSKFDEGPDLVLFYKRLMVLEGNPGYEHHINKDDSLSESQQAYIDTEWRKFREWWKSWPGAAKESL